MGLVGTQEREAWSQARLSAAASRSVRPRRTLPEPPAAPPISSVVPGFGVIMPPPPVPKPRSLSPPSPPAVP